MATILILEDDFDLATSWRKALEAAGHSVEIASTSRQAAIVALRKGFDVYVVDIIIEETPDGLPDSGLHLLSFLKRDNRKKKVIGVSGYRSEKHEHMMERLFAVYRAATFLPKPFAAQELVDLVAAEG